MHRLYNNQPIVGWRLANTVALCMDTRGGGKCCLLDHCFLFIICIKVVRHTVIKMSVKGNKWLGFRMFTTLRRRATGFLVELSVLHNVDRTYVPVVLHGRFLI